MGGSLPGEAGLDFEGFQVRVVPKQELQAEPPGREAAARGGDSTMESWAWSCQAADTLV